MRAFGTMVLLTTNTAAPATNCERISDKQARACCHQNRPQQSMQQRIRLTVADQQGTVSDLAGELYWKRFDDAHSRTRARVDLTAPPRQSGTRVLLTERPAEADTAPPEPEVVLYKPDDRRDRLLSVSALSGEMFGTDFSYEDFAYFYGTDPDVDIERLPDEPYNGSQVMVVQSTPRDPEAAFDRGSSYTRIVTRFDAQSCVPLHTGFFEHGDALRKELITNPASIRRVGERNIPFELTMHDRTRDSRTILTIEEIRFEADLRDSLFSRSSLKRGR